MNEGKEIKFSICILTYNQEKYIKETIESVLNQTYQNFEIIIGDDCSTDSTREVVKNINDSRIKLVKTPYNMGINPNFNNAINNATGDYIIFFGGDDKLRPDYLKALNEVLQEDDYAVVYPNITRIDENSNYIQGENVPIYDFKKYSSREWIIHKLFMKTNFLDSVAIAIKKDAMNLLLPLDFSLMVYSDYQLHVMLLMNQNNKFKFLDNIYAEYRMFNDGRNISTNSNGDNIKRNAVGMDLFLDTFLQIKDIDFLKRIFEKEIKETGIEPYEDTIPFFLGQMALASKDKNRQSWGFRTVAKFISTEQGYNIVHNRYGFIFKDYLSLINKINGSDISDFYGKYKKYKKLFNMTISVSGIIIVLFLVFLICELL